MSSYALTEWAKEVLHNPPPADFPLDADPFERKADRVVTRARYDAIRMESAQDHYGGLRLGFSWRGNVILWMRFEGVRIENNVTLNIYSGVEGYIRITPTLTGYAYKPPEDVDRRRTVRGRRRYWWWVLLGCALFALGAFLRMPPR